MLSAGFVPYLTRDGFAGQVAIVWFQARQSPVGFMKVHLWSFLCGQSLCFLEQPRGVLKAVQMSLNSGVGVDCCEEDPLACGLPLPAELAGNPEGVLVPSI